MFTLLFTRTSTDSGESVSILGCESLPDSGRNILDLATQPVKVESNCKSIVKLKFPQGNSDSFAKTLSSMLSPFGIKLKVA